MIHNWVGYKGRYEYDSDSEVLRFLAEDGSVGWRDVYPDVDSAFSAARTDSGTRRYYDEKRPGAYTGD